MRSLLADAVARLVLALSFASAAPAETGADLWLRYRALPPDVLAETGIPAPAILVEGTTATGGIVRDELRRGLGGLLGTTIAVVETVGDAGLVVGTPSGSPAVAGLGLADDLAGLGDEGFLIRELSIGDRRVLVVASASEIGALYGTFHLLRLVQTGQPLAGADVVQRPKIGLRMLDHWDNLDGTVERGYAGRSIWKWDELPETLDPRLLVYARANASLGINGAVLNNVNADPQALSPEHLRKVAVIADAFRPYGIRVYLSANFAAPKVLGGLPTADPFDPDVGLWWRRKAAEIYDLIPDFGGFLVKANSEGQPGPRDYGRSHGDGANLLADALRAHGGVVIWRAFVYDADIDPDRVKRAYLELKPLDGTLRDNVLLQAKNGPLDFMPREPFHPLFGAMPKTPLMAELQVTQEYLGHANHLVYLAPMWEEFLRSDTFATGPGSTVARVIDGSLYGGTKTGIAGVANTGQDENWTGHHFAQANWYAFGRLAWDPDLDAAAVADEWIRRTWGHDPAVVAVVRSMMLESRETFVRYTMPLGLHHLIGGDHYEPMPENPDPRRADWSAIYYHRADDQAIGFDRTAEGSGAVLQYHPPLAEQWGSPETCPDELLLWFHRLPWDFRMKSGLTLWEEIVVHYRQGAEEARQLEARWRLLEGKVDERRYREVLAKLQIQTEEASAWSQKCLRYFQGFSGGAIR